MNALFELIGSTKFMSEEEVTDITNTSEYTIEVGKPFRWGIHAGKIKVTFNYKPTSKLAKNWIKTIAFAKIQYGNDYDDDRCTLKLRSNRTERDEQSFLESLASIDYDNGYGGQELFGTIVFKDGTWLERGEYDGSEWWEHRKLPTEKSLFNE